MNRKCYKLIYSRRLGIWIAVSERTSGYVAKASPRGASAWLGVWRSMGVNLILVAALSRSHLTAAQDLTSQTLPTGVQMINGAVDIQTNGSTLTMTQTSPAAIVNWDRFSIGSASTVHVIQPSAQSVHLDRVVGALPSQIMGRYTSNGQLFLINPNGIVVGSGGSVTATSFTASTFGVSDAQFMAGVNRFQADKGQAGIVIEAGAEIHTSLSQGGYVALLANQIKHQGQVVTQGGDVLMLAGQNVQFDQAWSLPLSRRVHLEILQEKISSKIETQRDSVVKTQGGHVLIQSAALVDAISSQQEVIHAGQIDTSAEHAGDIQVTATHGQVWVSGEMNASPTSSLDEGGNIAIGRDTQTGALASRTVVRDAKLETQNGLLETSGDYLDVNEMGQVVAKNWLLDPFSIVIDEMMTFESATQIGEVYLPNINPLTQTSHLRASTVASALSAGINVTVEVTDSAFFKGVVISPCSPPSR